MDVRFVETLLLVLESGSLAETARRQGMTAAAVSQRVAALEQHLNVALLQRDGRSMAATPECESLLVDLREIVALHAGLAGRLAQERLQGRLRLGMISTALGDYGAALIQRLRDAAPEVSLDLVPGASAALYQQFVAGQLDAAVLVLPPFDLPKTQRFDALARHPIGLLRRHDVAQEAPFLVYSRAAWGGALCWQVLERLSPSPQVLCEMDAPETIAQMVKDGVGQAVLPQWGGLGRHFETLNFSPAAEAFRTVGVLTHRREATRPAMSLLRQTLAALAPEAQQR